jgi:hypothetical protein
MRFDELPADKRAAMERRFVEFLREIAEKPISQEQLAQLRAKPLIVNWPEDFARILNDAIDRSKSHDQRR